MTSGEQRQQVREAIARIICPLRNVEGECKRCAGCPDPDAWNDIAEQVDKILSLTMLAVLAENQELPENPYGPYTGNDPETQNANETAEESYLQAQQDMLRAGWRRCLSESRCDVGKIVLPDY